MRKEKIIMRKNRKKELYNLNYFIRRVASASPAYIAASFIGSILETAIPFVGILLPKFIIDELMGRRRIPELCFLVLVAAITTLLLSVSSNALKRFMKAEVRNILLKFEEHLGSHNMKVAYEKLEDSDYIELNNSAMMPIRDRMTHLFMIRYLPDMIRYIITAVSSICIIIRFDRISLVVILLPTIIITLLNQSYQKKDMEIQREYVRVQRPYMYYFNLMSDFGSGKDIRLFNLQDLLMKRNNECDHMIHSFKQKSARLRYRFEGMSKVLEGLRGAFVYGYIGVKSLLKNIGIGNFTMYIGAANAFSISVANLFEATLTLRQDLRYLDDYVKLEEIPVEEEKGGITEIDGNNIYIEFKHVTFRYPGSSQDVLKELSFSFRPKESISVVGRNGAGKTTIIKLLARLFKPTEGKILMNGVDIQAIDSNTYQKIISVVFQDFKIFEFSIAENITAGQELDEERLKYSLETAGIMEKVKQLRNGMETFIGKQFDKNGTEFSGGELQKLAIARSLYKNSPVIVLDEPTAALDPYAEEEIYERFNKLTHGRSTVYISHRLSSCKFCDRILFLDYGKIIEDGNHDELMNANGKYAKMFRLQASQYIT